MENVLIVHEVPWLEPLEAFSTFAGDPVAALLHGDGANEMGRWSYIAASPFRTIIVDADMEATIDGRPAQGDPFHLINIALKSFPIEELGPAPFLGGAVGFFGYEMGGLVESLPPPKTGATNPALVVGLYDVVVAFDHVEQKTWVIATGFPETIDSLRRNRAQDRARWMIDQIQSRPESQITMCSAEWSAEQSRIEVKDSIQAAIELINAGDAFQTNITQRFIAQKPKNTTPWDLFLQLRKTLPSPFGAYVAGSSKFHVLSASPERFLQATRHGSVETRPIKGTRPRHKDPATDRQLATDLAQSPKDNAENLMIVDLMRNDISRVCESGSVSVPQCCQVETFARVHHLVSVVTGELRADKSAIDLLRACFPGGSVTGAPKVRAMEIIHELEPSARGPYCGAIAWIGFDGAMDSAIVIRSLIVDDDQVIAQAGGGIVADSDPSLEYEEAMVKLRPLLPVLDPTATI
jgi:para-aminobenzoate synthetase component 1